MSRTSLVDGIVLSRRNVGEADKIVTLFTRGFGKKKCLAKGIRKVGSKRGPLLEPFSHVRLLLRSSSYIDIATEVAPIATHELLRTRLERVSMGYIALELIERFTVFDEEQDDIFHALHTFISRLNDSTLSRTHAYEYLTAFKRNTLTSLGFYTQNQSDALLDSAIENILESRLRSSSLLTAVSRVL